MSVMLIVPTEQDGRARLWQCKQCSQLITDDQNVAYHLVDRILYGWCESCFARRNEAIVAAA